MSDSWLQCRSLFQALDMHQLISRRCSAAPRGSARAFTGRLEARQFRVSLVDGLLVWLAFTWRQRVLKRQLRHKNTGEWKTQGGVNGPKVSYTVSGNHPWRSVWQQREVMYKVLNPLACSISPPRDGGSLWEPHARCLFTWVSTAPFLSAGPVRTGAGKPGAAPSTRGFWKAVCFLSALHCACSAM